MSKRVSWFNYACLVAVLLSVAAALSYESNWSQASPPDAAIPAEEAIDADELLTTLAADFSPERVEQALSEQFDALPDDAQRLLPPGFKERFLKRFMAEGYQELRGMIEEELFSIFDDDELRALLAFHRQHPGLCEKQQQLAKKIVKRSSQIGERIGRDLAR
jgi:hypothetical protein